MPMLYFAGGGWVAVVVVGVVGLLFSIVFMKYKQSQHKSDAGLSEETLKMTPASNSCSESVPILQ